MIRYVAAATALKLFSLSPETREAYRVLCRTVGARRRASPKLAPTYLDRAEAFLALCIQFGAIRDGARCLELGTGWLHWEATVIRLFYELEVTLFDMQDIRQLAPYRQRIAQLRPITNIRIVSDPRRLEQAQEYIERILRCESFEDLYRLMNFRYVVDERGITTRLPDDHFDTVFSVEVLEHVHAESLLLFVRDLYRLTKPGGLSLHNIDMGDHIAYYDAGVSIKNYIRYSERDWSRYFQSGVQYFNRVQRPQWLELFAEAGFELIEELPDRRDLGGLPVAERFRGLSRDDLECTSVILVHKKPGGASAS